MNLLAADSARGLPVLFSHLAVTCIALLFVGVAASVGLRLTTMRDRPLGSPLLTLAAATAIGFGAIATLLLAAIAAFGVTPWPIWSAVAVSTLLAASGLRELVRLVVESAREWRRVGNAPANLALVLIIALLWLAAVPAPVDFDSLMYHLRGPELYLQAGELVAPEGNSHVAYVGALHTLYLPFLLLGLNSAPAILQSAFLALTIVAVAAATDAWFRLRAGWIVVILALGTPIFLRVAATAMVDATAACTCVLAQLLFLAALRRPRSGMMFAAVGGALLGVAVGTKILSAGYAFATAVTLLPLVLIRRRSRVIAPRLLVTAFATALLVAAPWLLRTFALYGSPTYPYLSERELPAWTSVAPEAVAGVASTSGLRSVRQPFTLRAWFLAPETLTPEGDGYLFGASFAFALLLLIPFLPRRGRQLALILPALLFLVIVLGWSRFLNLRYLMPLLLPLTAASAVVLAQLLRWLRSAVAVQLTGTVAATALVFSPAVDLVRELEFGERPLAAIGALEPARYRSRHNEIESLAAFLNTSTPDSARVLFLFEARAFGIQRSVVQDNVMENWRLLRPAIAAGSCLQEFGFTHLVLGRATLRYLVARGWPAQETGLNEIDPFLARCTVAATGDARHGVFTLRSAATLEAPADTASTSAVMR